MPALVVFGLCAWRSTADLLLAHALLCDRRAFLARARQSDVWDELQRGALHAWPLEGQLSAQALPPSWTRPWEELQVDLEASARGSGRALQMNVRCCGQRWWATHSTGAHGLSHRCRWRWTGRCWRCCGRCEQRTVRRTWRRGSVGWAWKQRRRKQRHRAARRLLRSWSLAATRTHARAANACAGALQTGGQGAGQELRTARCGLRALELALRPCAATEQLSRCLGAAERRACTCV